jgi:hypothetical protein
MDSLTNVKWKCVPLELKMIGDMTTVQDIMNYSVVNVTLNHVMIVWIVTKCKKLLISTTDGMIPTEMDTSTQKTGLMLLTMKS